MNWTRRDTLIVAALLAAPFVLCAPFFLPGAARLYLSDRDFVDQFYAFAAFETRELAAGHLPLWNPYAYAGSPFWADIQAAVAYPFSLLGALAGAVFFKKLPFAVLELEAVGHLSLAAALMYLFARRALGSRPGALVAALCFAFGGYLTGYPLRQLAILKTDVWLPLALLGVDQLAQAQGRAEAQGRPAASWRSTLWVGLALGLAVLAGHPQTALYLFYTTLAYWAWKVRPWPLRQSEVSSPTLHSGTNAPRSTRLAPWLWLAAALAIGAGLSAAGWLPAAEYLRLSNRAAADYTMLGNGFPPGELLGAVLPGLTVWSPLYVGIWPLLVALAAVWMGLKQPGSAESRLLESKSSDTASPASGFSNSASPAARSLAQSDIRFWAALALVALLLSLGRHSFLFDLFYLAAPGFNLFRGQERAALVDSFSLAMLAGAGVAMWWAGERRLAHGVANGAAALAGLGILVALVAGPELRQSALRVVFLSGAAALLAYWNGPRRAIGGPRRPVDDRPGAVDGAPRVAPLLWLVAAVGLVVVDLASAVPRHDWLSGAPGELQTSPVIAALKNGSQRIVNHDRLPENFGVLHGLESITGASPLRLATYDHLRAGLSEQWEKRWWDLLAVSHILTWRDRLDVPAVPLLSSGSGQEAVHLYQLVNAAPYVWRALAAERVASDAAAVERLRDPAFNPFLTVLLHEGEAGSPGLKPGNEYASAEVGVLPGGTGEVNAATTSDTAGWLVFAQSWYPGWRATLDGRPAAVLRADVALMAVAVPAGRHEVRLMFAAPLVWAGLAISGATLALLLAAAAVGLWRGRRRSRVSAAE